MLRLWLSGSHPRALNHCRRLLSVAIRAVCGCVMLVGAGGVFADEPPTLAPAEAAASTLSLPSSEMPAAAFPVGAVRPDASAAIRPSLALVAPPEQVRRKLYL